MLVRALPRIQSVRRSLPLARLLRSSVDRHLTIGAFSCAEQNVLRHARSASDPSLGSGGLAPAPLGRLCSAPHVPSSTVSRRSAAPTLVRRRQLDRSLDPV